MMVFWVTTYINMSISHATYALSIRFIVSTCNHHHIFVIVTLSSCGKTGKSAILYTDVMVRFNLNTYYMISLVLWFSSTMYSAQNKI